MVWWAAAVYLAIILLTALVSSRIRAEAGIPLIWLFPFYQQKKVLLYTLGASAFISPGAPATLTIFALMTLLARGYLPALSGYQIESLKMADETAIPRNRMAAWIMVAALVGFALAFYIHLTTYYHYGAQNLNGVWGEWLAVPEFDSVVAAQQTHLPPDVSRTFATLAGAALTLGMVLLRRRFVGFPLHPLGYAVATSYGSLVWWSFLVVWVLKSLILKWGGMRLYRRAIPFFLGFALGHFFAAGMVWGLVGAFWRAGANAYPVWFG